MIKKYPAQVVAIHNPIEGVYTLELESMGKPFKYDVGQFLHLAIDEYDPSGQWPESRCFSIQTSPSEETIKITVAIDSQTLKFFKEYADKSGLKYQRIIREVLKGYARRYG